MAFDISEMSSFRFEDLRIFEDWRSLDCVGLHLRISTNQGTRYALDTNANRTRSTGAPAGTIPRGGDSGNKGANAHATRLNHPGQIHLHTGRQLLWIITSQIQDYVRLAPVKHRTVLDFHQSNTGLF